MVKTEKPFLILGGEVHNSTTSNAQYFLSKIDKLKKLNCNTLILPVYWELIEPSEGAFDFTLTDHIIDICTKNDFRVVILWFGTWKNAYSMYVPEWVKVDKARFFRARTKSGKPHNAVSCFCDEARDADANAFTALMKHIKETDTSRTVVMIQIENEVGVLDMRRDYCPAANEKFQGNVDAELTEYLKANTKLAYNYTGENWSSVFSDMADEVFMAYHIAKYVEEVARRGKEEYDIPMYVNTWLVQYENQAPGDYPSGGPTHRVIDIWRAAAPHIDFIAPDIYLDDFPKVCSQYTRDDNPLFIPEARRDDTAVANLLYAIGKYRARGFAPFGIESMENGEALAEAYLILTNMMEIIETSYEKGCITGVHWLDKESLSQTIGGFSIKFHPYRNDKKEDRAGGAIVITEDTGKYTIIGQNIRYSFDYDDVEFIHIKEGKYDRRGEWIDGRRLNGDEIYQTRFGEIAGVQRVYVQSKE